MKDWDVQNPKRNSRVHIKSMLYTSSSCREHIWGATETLVGLRNMEHRMRLRATDGCCDCNTMRGADWLQSDTSSIFELKKSKMRESVNKLEQLRLGFGLIACLQDIKISGLHCHPKRSSIQFYPFTATITFLLGAFIN